MTNVSDQEFETAWNNTDNQKMLAAVCYGFSNRLSAEELLDCSYIALLKCLKKHESSHNTKFTTSLYRYITWECKKAIRTKIRQWKYTSLPEITLHTVDTIYVHDCMDRLPSDYSDIIHDYYFKGMTLKEIGEKNGYIAVTAMRKLRRAEEEFRRLYVGE